MVIWYQHKKYTAEYMSGQLAEICDKVKRETRRMVYVATAATGFMALVQAAYLYNLLGA